MEIKKKHLEFDLVVGNSIRIGDMLVTIVDTMDDQAAVRIEELNVGEELNLDRPVSMIRPR